MRARRRGAIIGIAAALLSVRAAPAGAQREPYAVDSVRVELAVAGDSARVRARYWFARPARALDFTHLTNTCTRVGAVVARRDGLAVALVADSNPPWVVLHDTTDAAAQPAMPFRYDVEYLVTSAAGGRMAVPLVQPAGALDPRGAPMRPRVGIVVRTAGGADGEPRLPRFTRSGEGEWTARMSAAPATVVMRRRGAAATTCDDGVMIPGEHAGFVRRVGLFLATIVLWIPLYFWWAGRRRAEEAEDAT